MHNGRESECPPRSKFISIYDYNRLERVPCYNFHTKLRSFFPSALQWVYLKREKFRATYQSQATHFAIMIESSTDKLLGVKN
jgi:hypothetical protein